MRLSRASLMVFLARSQRMVAGLTQDQGQSRCREAWMWLAIKEQILKEAAGKKPPQLPPEQDKLLTNELGLQGAIHYRRLLDRFPTNEYPEAGRGPDETIENHYSRLKGMLDQ